MYNNVIRKYVMNIDLDHVCPPYLHILLGVVKKHHDLLEKECHSIDLAIAQHLAENQEDLNCDCSTTYQNYVDQLREIEKLKWKRDAAKRRLESFEPDESLPLAMIRRQQTRLRDKVSVLEKKLDHQTAKLKPLPFLSGPVTANLDTVLRGKKITMQAYHGRSFVGNHCHKYLKSDVIDAVCDSVLSKTAELCTNGSLRAKAYDVSNKFKDLNVFYSYIHECVSHQRKISTEDTEQIQQCIDMYLSFYRKEFPLSRVTPKQHLLESHCVPWIRRWGFGLALHGEQGGEETHATINLLKIKVRSLRNQDDQLKTLMREHMTLISPVFHGMFSLEKRKKH